MTANVDPAKGVEVSLATCDGVSDRAREVAEYFLDTRPDVPDGDKESFLDIATAAAHLALSPEVHVKLGSPPLDVSGILNFRQTLAPGERVELYNEGEA